MINWLFVAAFWLTLVLAFIPRFLLDVPQFLYFWFLDPSGYITFRKNFLRRAYFQNARRYGYPWANQWLEEITDIANILEPKELNLLTNPPPFTFGQYLALYWWKFLPGALGVLPLLPEIKSVWSFWSCLKATLLGFCLNKEIIKLPHLASLSVDKGIRSI